LALHATDQFTVTLTVTATATLVATGATATTAETLTVTAANVPPTATLSGPTGVSEGDDFTVALIRPSDPSSADTAAGFHYAFAVDDASLAGASYTNSGPSASRTFRFADGPSDHTLTARIFDKDAGFTEYTTAVHVTNVAPTAAIHGTPASSPEG